MCVCVCGACACACALASACASVCACVCVSVSVFPMDLHCDAVFSDCECDILVLVPDNSSVMSICQQRP